MRTEDLELTDPDAPGPAADWADELQIALNALRRAATRRDQISRALAAEPATGLLAAAQQTAAAANDAAAALQTAVDERMTRQHAAALEADHVATAQDAVDAAIRAVGQELTRLLAGASMSAALTATIDGLGLRGRYRTAIATTPPTWDMATIPFRATKTAPALDPQITLPGQDESDYAALLAVLHRLDDVVDAISDLVTAEGVHHLVNGNPVRSGAVLDIAAGGAVPDTFDVIRTPTPGYDITNRVAVVLDPDRGARWTSATRSRADAVDPELAAWVSTLLPDPAGVALRAYPIDPTGAAGAPLDLTADALDLGALDWLRLCADRAELMARVARAARARWAAEPPADLPASFRIVVADPPDAAGPGLPDLVAAAGAARALLSACRPLTGADLAAPGAAAPPADAGLPLVLDRLAAAERDVADVLGVLRDASTWQEAGSAFAVLFDVASLGIAEATPPLADRVPSLDELAALGRSAADRLAARVAGGPIDPVRPDALDQARIRLGALYGPGLKLLARCPVPADPLVLRDLGDQPPRIAGATPAALRAWLHDHAPVRLAVAALLDAHDIAEMLLATTAPSLRATHLPSAVTSAGDDSDPRPWAGDTGTPPPGLVNLVVLRHYEGAPPSRVAGLIVDAWPRTVPADELPTGLAFHYDQPPPSATQAALVAVAPDTGPGHEPVTWDLETLAAIVLSTMDLAADRARAAELVPDSAIAIDDPA
ncbi:hypothetical protein GCM10020358_23360 [Amorphoplanes nipponensis]|uniref:Uncharacterized protein n=1 Tax=Actinoplanes nipponensis TaxID=135950 RepID=A0A919JM81_9ACTN|nr:hypothetical protein [Actinoplanes nipponensis]GIE53171.1 hypothetical protein Ani05nite_67050 [Actinoplanes nipponensis]